MSRRDRVNSRGQEQPYEQPRPEETESVGALTKRLIAEARARAEADSRLAASRSTITKVLLVLTLLAVAASVATFAYGIYNFPDAPIRPDGGGYVGKTGHAHTRDHYENYLTWSLTMWSVFPATFAVAFTFGYFDWRDRSRSRR
jgi:hypothetical protein